MPKVQEKEPVKIDASVPVKSKGSVKEWEELKEKYKLQNPANYALMETEKHPGTDLTEWEWQESKFLGKA